MAPVGFTDQAPPVSMRQIEELEQRIGIALPASYKAFLLRTNGGVPSLDRLIVPGWCGGATCVNQFLGLGEGEHYDLESSFRNSEEYVPSGYLPIAVDTGGNMLCLGVSGSGTGRVYFWDHENPQGNDLKHLLEVAADVEDLLGKLLPP